MLRPAWAFAVADPDAAPRPAGPRIVCRPGSGPPAWLESGGWRLLARPEGGSGSEGEILATFAVEGGGKVRARRDPDGSVVVPFSLTEAYHAYIAEAWRAAGSPRRLSERQLALFYRVKKRIPRRAQLAARRALIRHQGVPTFPAWPLDTSVSRLLHFFAGCALHAAGRAQGEFAWFWPNRHRAAIVLTHDVEGEEGIRLALELADLEQEHGFRSAFNFGAWYEIDPGVLRELTGRGFEVGMHGLVHDRTLFSSREAFEASLPALAELAERLGAVGFRSPGDAPCLRLARGASRRIRLYDPELGSVRAAARGLLLGLAVPGRTGRRASVHPPPGSHAADAALPAVAGRVAGAGRADRGRIRSRPVRLAPRPRLPRRPGKACDLRGVPAGDGRAYGPLAGSAARGGRVVAAAGHH